MHNATQTPLQLSYLNIVPGNEAEFISRLVPNTSRFDDIVNFINNITLANNDTKILYYGGNNYLHFATPYPDIFRAILDLCPRQQLYTELVKTNFFGESVLHKACQHEFSLKYALHSMVEEIKKPEFSHAEKKQKHQEIINLILLKSSVDVYCYEVLIWKKNAKGLDFVLSCFSNNHKNLIIQQMRQTVSFGGTTTSIFNLAMKNTQLREVLLAHLPENQNSFFNSNNKRKSNSADIQETTSEKMPAKKMS